MPNSPTIVSAALSDKELQASINQMVANFDKGLQDMLDHSNKYVEKIQESLQKIGNTNFGAKGSNDGGVVKQTKQHKELTEAVSKETQKLQDLQQSLSGASDREQYFISQKERAANTISKENELLQRQEQELSQLKSQQQQLADAEKNGAQSAQQQESSTNRLKNRLSDLNVETRSAKAALDLLKNSRTEQLSPIAYTKNKAYDELAVANKLWDIMKRLKMDMNNGSLMTGSATEPIQKLAEYFKISREEAEKMVRTLRESSVVMGKYKMSFDTRFGLYDLSMEKRSMLDKNSPYYSTKSDWELRQEKASWAYEQALRREESAERDLAQATQQSSQASQQKAQIDAQVAAKEKEIAETKVRIATATKEQSEAEKNASQAAKEKANIQSQVANQEKKVAEAKKQLTTATQQHTDAETKSSRAAKEKTLTLDQQASAINTAVQSEKKYTDEVLRQAAAIRSSKEWQEKGHVVIGDVNYYDKERANVSKRDKQMLLSLEEQILQKENERIAAQERQNRESQREVEIKSQLPKQGFLFTNEDVISNKVNNARAARYKQLQEEEKYVNSRNAAIAKALHIGQEEIKNYDVRTASAKKLNAMLKQQQDAYSRLSTAQRSQKGGTELLSSIQNTQRALQKLQLQMSRPVNLKAALAGSEATLDEVAYKIRRLQAYMQGLDATNERSAAEIKKVAFNIELLKQKQNDLLNKNSQLIGSNNSLIKSNTALGRSWNYMKNRLAFYFTVGASTQFVKNLIEIRSQYEMTERALGILVNSAERGTQIFNELSQMALVSPYTLIELSGAAKQLVAYDVAAKDVVDTTRRLADMASAVGVPMERLTYALGQIKAYGYLNSRDNRMFANAGIPLVKQLADYYTELEGKLVSTADVYDRIKKKAVGYADVMQVITKMTDEGGKFFDFQEKMSGTLKVQIANLTLAWNNMLNEIGASEQGILTAGIAGLKNLFLAWKDLSNILTTIAAIFGIVKAQQIFANIAVGKSTVSLIGYINANKEATWVEYTRALQTKKLTAAQAAWLLMTNKNNAALAASLVRLKVLDVATVRYLTTMSGLSAGLLRLRIMGTMALNGLIKGVKALGAAFMTNLPLVALTAAIDLFTHFNSVASSNKSFNEDVANGANEAAKALENFTKEEDKVQARAKAASGNLSDTEAKKVWEAIREQIELSSQAANIFIPQLLSITNINERVTAAFNLADKIQETTNKLGELRDEMEVSQDSWLWGLFGEGIGEDLDDYNKRVKELREQTKYFAEGETSVWEDLKIAINGVWDGIGGGSGSQSAKEAVREIEKFANNAADVIKEKLGKEGVLDEKQVTEAVARFVKAAEQQIPEIRGAGKKLFEALTNDIMGKQFEVFNAQEYYYSAFLEQLKKDYGSKFADITEDIKNKTVVWSDAQKKAIKETADKVKKDWPQASRDAIDEILKDLNNTEFKLHLVATFSSDLTDFQQQFRDRANNLGVVVAETLEKFSPQSGDDLPSWTKKQQENIKALREENKTYEKDSSDWAKQRIAANNTEIEGRTKALSLFKQSAISDKDAAKNKNKAESELQKALKEELSTIDKVRSIYKDLTKEGMSHANAVERATRGWDETVNAINKVLQKNGLQKLDLSKFAGIENPRELVNMLQSQLNTLLKRGAKPAEIKELQTKVNTLEVDADKYDLTKITKGLNNELGKLKDEYELAVELDANPELGGIFADMMGLNKEQLSQMPKDFDGVVERLQKIIDNKLGAGKFNLMKNLNKASFDAWLEANKQGKPEDDALAKSLESIIDYANKVRLDSSKKQIEEWNKLLEKYAEYEYKVTQIQKEAEREREIARKKGASQEILDAINNREKQELARVSFEEFQKSPEWIVATGDLANMSKSAIGMLIEQLEKYKRSAKNLSPKQIKQLNSALSKLYKEQRKNNPFKAISNMLDEAKEHMATFDEDIEKTQKEIDNLTKKKKESIVKGVADEETDNKLKKAIKRLKELKEAREKTSKVDASSWVSSINETIGAVQSAIGVFNDLAKAIGGVDSSDLDKVFSVVDKAGQGAAIGAQIGKGWGALIGAVAGAATGFISVFAGAANERITESVKKSEVTVKRLELAYIDLEHAINSAYGTATIGAQKLAIANKELQLSELKRQLALEQSRSSKNRDDDRIVELQKQIKELEYDIKDSVDEIVNNLLGISSVGDAMESLMDGFIEALRNGENAMSIFNESVDEMIANMVKKMFTTKILQPWFEKQWDLIQNGIDSRVESLRFNGFPITEWIAKNEEALESAKNGTDNVSRYANRYSNDPNDIVSKEVWIRQTEELLKRAKEMFTEATIPTTDDIRKYAELLRSGQPILEENMQEIEAFLRELGLMNNTKDNQLSALQQGIQGITEETAGALEAITNGISQQSYLQSELLTQIRDAVVGMDIDVQTASLSQILLQLQSSYQVQMSIQGILEGVLVPSGRAFAVELLS